ncbi:MAG: nucleoside triphosphate pyrophosphohydrolase [Gammaproteobacteria bacterium]|nr:MAG: nucleoside triphosphate pyrophosphohydrolase [Gammaproteobacteria bacterium]
MGVAHGIDDLLQLMARLRDPQDGCPWDLKQDFPTIAPSTLEEAYELVQAIAENDPGHIREELGDLLFQVVFYARMGEERGWFSFAEVVDGLTGKLLRRHPHVFPEGTLQSRRPSGDVVDESSLHTRWEATKHAERAGRDHQSLMDDVPLALPALSRAQKLQKRAALAGFDWPEVGGVLAKLDEELAELEAARVAADRDQQARELGDVLFTAVNLARHWKFDSETLLRDTARRFEQRFRWMEQQAARQGQELAGMDPDQRESLWEQAKAREASGLEPDAPDV